MLKNAKDDVLHFPLRRKNIHSDILFRVSQDTPWEIQRSVPLFPKTNTSASFCVIKDNLSHFGCMNNVRFFSCWILCMLGMDLTFGGIAQLDIESKSKSSKSDHFKKGASQETLRICPQPVLKLQAGSLDHLGPQSLDARCIHRSRHLRRLRWRWSPVAPALVERGQSLRRALQCGSDKIQKCDGGCMSGKNKNHMQWETPKTGWNEEILPQETKSETLTKHNFRSSSRSRVRNQGWVDKSAVSILKRLYLSRDGNRFAAVFGLIRYSIKSDGSGEALL